MIAWLLLAIVTNTAWAQLSEVIERRALPTLPAGSQSADAFNSMASAFDEEGAQNAAIIALTGPDGFSSDAQAVNRELVQRLTELKPDVLSVTDLATEERTRAAAVSEDGRAWMLTVRLAGDIGSPETAEHVANVRETVDDVLSGTGLQGYVTGPPGTIADNFIAAHSALAKITAATAVLIAIILLVVYRSVITAVLPLLAVGVGLVVARGIVAGLGLFGMPVSQDAQALMTVVVLAAGIDYSVFLISRWHEQIRAGEPWEEAIASATATMGRVITASAATVIAASVAIMFADLAGLAACGPMLAVGVAVGLATALTLFPALLAFAARRGYAMPKNERTQGYWQRVGEQVTRRPRRLLAVSLAVLLMLAALSMLMRPGYDDRAALPASVDSNRGYELLVQHFPKDLLYPQYLIIRSQTDLRTPEGLADLEQMASRVAQLPGVTAVRGITRPNGEKLTEATLAWQIGQLGDQIAEAAGSSGSFQDQMSRFSEGIRLMSEAFGDVDPGAVDGVLAAVPGFFELGRRAQADLARYRPLIDTITRSRGLLESADHLAGGLDHAISAVDSVLALTGPAEKTLRHLPGCTANHDCNALLVSLHTLAEVRRSGALQEVVILRDEIRKFTNGRRLTEVVAELRETFLAVESGIAGVDLPALEARIQKFTELYGQLRLLGLTDIGSVSQTVTDAIDRTNDMVGGLEEAADYLQTVGQEASAPSASGFYVPPDLLNSPDFATAAAFFISADGRVARYLVQSNVDPYSEDAMRQVGRITEVANGALPNTALAGATVALAGFPTVNSDLQQYFNGDFRLIVIATLSVVFVILVLLLRAIVAPIYLLASVALTYLSAIGAGVLLFQVILGQQLLWPVPAMTFILLVAVGADYNMLLVSRLREESGQATREGVARTITHTGAVITSAGMIFAASMFGLIAGQLMLLTQLGFVIGIGILLDTFVIRTVVVPAIAALLGPLNWWPSRVEAD